MTHQTRDWEQILWDAGHRVTRQRALILDEVCAAGGHTPFSTIYMGEFAKPTAPSTAQRSTDHSDSLSISGWS